ncbi:hypothetical protein [Streptomyces tendae]|uniref:hypothetical protein n=1 Tax=Streptomyces tendae TaxID=1932 RepID=UPI00384C2677
MPPPPGLHTCYSQVRRAPATCGDCGQTRPLIGRRLDGAACCDPVLRGRPGLRSLAWTRSLIRQPQELLAWLDDEGIALADLNQSALDRWLSHGGPPQ